MLPVDLVGFQNLLQVVQQLLHVEDHRQLSKKKKKEKTTETSHTAVLANHGFIKLNIFEVVRHMRSIKFIMCT